MKRVADRWREIARKARRRVRRLDRWPWRNTERHIEAAQFSLEVERARRAGGEKGKKL